jgi:hypothetical protein
MREYCEEFGVAFSGPEDLPRALQQMQLEYAKLKAKIRSFPNDSETMVSNYLKHLSFLDAHRDSIVKNRDLCRNPMMLARSLFPI